jgi:hypothetical protein
MGLVNQLIELLNRSRIAATSNTLTNDRNHPTAGIPQPNSNNLKYPAWFSPGTIRQKYGTKKKSFSEVITHRQLITFTPSYTFLS